LPFISASCHGFIAVSFGFIATGSLPSPKPICLLAPPNPFAFWRPQIHLPSGAPNLFAYWRPICLLAPQIYLLFWHPICLLAPPSIRCAITIPMTIGLKVITFCYAPSPPYFFFLKIL
jgi:hypothetical protein